MINRIFLCILFFLAFLTGYTQPAALDLTFNPGYAIGTNFGGTAFNIYALAVQSDQKILAGGTFASFDSVGHTQNLVRLQSNGHVDTSFVVDTPWTFNVKAIAIQPDGKIIAGGSLPFFDTTAVYIIRLNIDGPADTSFKRGTGFDGAVNALVIQPDGKILAGGGFTSYNGTACSGIARLNQDGTYDTTFHAVPGTVGGVQTIVLRPDNKIVIAGDFDSYDNDTLFRIALLNPDGSGVGSYNRLGGFDKAVFSLVLMQDTSTIAAGYFTSWDFQTNYSKLARIESNGTLHPGFNPGVPGPAPTSSSTVFAALKTSDNRILIGGTFTNFGGSASCFAAVDTFAQFDTTFNVGGGFDGGVYAIAVQADGKILASGQFNHYNGRTINSIARLFNCTTSQPGPIAGNSSYSCPGSVLTYSTSSVAGASSYAWSLPAGWSGNSDSTSITVIASDTGGIISVMAYNDSCGYSAAQSLAVQIIQPPAVPVCLVTVDSQSLHNIIIWEKLHTGNIDSFFIYRQDTSFIFTKIAAIPYDSLSEYSDTDTIANPNATAHQYKISVLDTCGVESPLSDYHSTIFLQDLGNGNLLWAPYEIENALNPVTFYRVYRDNSGNGNFIPLNVSIPGGNTSFTDVDAALYPNANYVLDVNWSISCTPTRAVNTTRSNIKHTKSLEAINDINEEDIKIYPNPASTTATIFCPSTVKLQSLQIMDLLGETIYNEPALHNQNNQPGHTINIHSLPKAVYMVKIDTDKGGVVRKLIIE